MKSSNTKTLKMNLKDWFSKSEWATKADAKYQSKKKIKVQGQSEQNERKEQKERLLFKQTRELSWHNSEIWLVKLKDMPAKFRSKKVVERNK